MIKWLKTAKLKSHYISSIYRKDLDIKNLNSKLEDEQSLVAQLQRKIKELQVSFDVLRREG